MSLGISTAVQRLPANIRAASGYNVGGAYPKLAFDFNSEYYRTNGGQKSFSDAMTFARAGNATMVDSDGLIKWAPHNLLTYSQSIGSGSWYVQNSATATPNTSTAPDGTATASTLVLPNTGAVAQLITLSGDQNSFSVWLKASSSVTVKIGFASPSDLTSCSVTTEWTLFTHSSSRTGTSYPQFYNDSGVEITIEAWGAHLYRSDLGGMVDNPDRGDSYVPTTSSAVYLPRRGHHKYNGDQWVNKGILAESEARTNLLEYSIPATENFYSVFNGATLTKDSAISPDGTQNASEFNEGSLSSPRYFTNGTSTLFTAGTQYVMSIYAKAGTQNYIQLTLPSAAFGLNQYANFDLSSGVIGTIGVDVNQATMQDAGNGWYRCSIAVTATTTATSNAGAVIANSATASRLPSYTGTNAYIYVYGFGVEAGSTPSSYIPTNGSSVTRAAETVTVPYANLPWPTPTYIGDELVTNGTFDTDISGWTNPSVSTFVWNSGVVDINRNNAALYDQPKQSISTVAGQTYVVTAEVTTGASFGNSIIIIETSAGGATLASDTFGTGVTGQLQTEFTATASSHNIIIGISGTPSATVSFDNISVREINPLSVSIAMMGEYTIADNNSAFEAYPLRWYADSSNQIINYIRTDQVGVKYQFRQYAAGSNTLVSIDTLSVGISVPFSVCGRYSSTALNGAVNGITATEASFTFGLPDLSTTDLQLAYDFMGTVSEFRIWDRDIQDTGIAEATKPSLEPSLSLTFDGQPSSFTNSGLTV